MHVIPAPVRVTPRQTVAMGQGSRTALVALVTGIAVAATGACGSPDRTPGADSTSVPGECLHVDVNGYPRWQGGTISAQVSQLGEELQQVANEHPDESSGVAFCSDVSSVGIYLSPANGPTRARAVELARAHPALVRITEVPHSLADQLAAMDTIRRLPEGSPMIGGYGPDARTGGLHVPIAPLDSTADEIRAQSGADVAAVRARIVAAVGPDLPLYFQMGERVTVGGLLPHSQP